MSLCCYFFVYLFSLGAATSRGWEEIQFSKRHLHGFKDAINDDDDDYGNHNLNAICKMIVNEFFNGNNNLSFRFCRHILRPERSYLHTLGKNVMTIHSYDINTEN